jgi:hypothetical protein
MASQACPLGPGRLRPGPFFLSARPSSPACCLSPAAIVRLPATCHRRRRTAGRRPPRPGDQRLRPGDRPPSGRGLAPDAAEPPDRALGRKLYTDGREILLIHCKTYTSGLAPAQVFLQLSLKPPHHTSQRSLPRAPGPRRCTRAARMRRLTARRPAGPLARWPTAKLRDPATHRRGRGLAPDAARPSDRALGRELYTDDRKFPSTRC